MKRILAFLFVFAFMPTIAIAGTYQTMDLTAYLEPSKLICSGLPDYPRNIMLDIPVGSMVGNLEEGLQYLYPEGKVAIYIFEFSGQGGAKEVEFYATRIDLLYWERKEYKGICVVNEWHPQRFH
jgi:hypothetical protein